MIRIVLIDSQRLFRASLKSLINSFTKCQVVLDVPSLKEVPKKYDSKSIQIVIFDSQNSSKAKFEKIKDFFSDSQVIILTNKTDRNSIMDYMGMGVAGYFSKEDSPGQLKKAIHDINYSYTTGEVRLGSVVRNAIVTGIDDKKKIIEYTERELQILKLVCKEKTNSEISEILGLSKRTIESHRRRMIDKTDCKSIIGVILNVFELKSGKLELKLKQNQAS